MISTISVGVDHIDLIAASRAGIPVGHTPGVLVDSTADLTLGLMLAVTRRMAEADRWIRGGYWARGWQSDLLLGTDLSKATVGIVGLGPIGEAGDLIYNGHEVIALLGRYPHVTLSLHGHVHANTATTMRLAGGHELTLMSLASTTEYPLQWHEVTLRPCALELRHRPIDAPELANASLLRENRPGFARVKNQSAADPGLYIRTC